MDRFLLGVNIVFPIFFVLFIGYTLKSKKVINDLFVSSANAILFYIAVTAKLFLDVKKAKFTSMNINYVLYIGLGCIGVFAMLWIVGRIFIKNNEDLTAFVHCGFRSNFLYVGIPILDSIVTNAEAKGAEIICISFGIVLYNILAITILTYYKGDRVNILKLIINICKNPFIIAICLGAIFNMMQIPLYEGFERGIKILANLCTPLALILIGSSLDFKFTRNDFSIVFSSALAKVCINALIMVPIAMFLNFSNEQILVAYVFFGAPCAINTYVMAKQMGSNTVMTSKIITVSFILSAFTFSIGLSLLNYLGIIR